MFSFDQLFERYDPCTALLAEVERDYPGSSGELSEGSTAGLHSIAEMDSEQAYAKLLQHPVGADLRPAAIRAVRRAAVLVDVRQAFQLAAVNVSLGLAGVSQRPPEDWVEWVSDHADRAVLACVEDECRGVERNHDVAFPLADHYQCLRTVLEIPFEKVRHATVSINGLPADQRLPIVRVFLQGISPGEVVLETQRPLEEIILSLQAGLGMLMSLQIDEEV